MTQIRLMRLSVLASIGAAVLAASPFTGVLAQTPAVARPSVVLITVDTLRVDHVGAYGGRGAVTPNIDALARHGLRFDNAFAHAPLTFPSHVSILTGELPVVHGVRDNGSQMLPAGETTVAERLKVVGYRTAAFVSSFILSRQFGLDRGFDTYDDRLPTAGPIIDDQLRRDGASTAAAAERWIASNAAAPFFLWVHFYDPHAPYPASDGRRNAYDEAIAAADAGVGRVVAALSRAGIADRTFILFTADHGEGLGDHGEQQHGLLVYDSVMHVPLVIAGPSLGPRAVTAQVCHIDIVPTILAIADMQSAGLPGSDLRTSAARPDHEAYGESWYGRIHFGWSDLRFLRADHWKYIDGPNPELYDVAHDPAESINLLSKRPELASAMKRRLAVISGDERTLPSPHVDSATVERLHALGYVSGPAPASAESRLADPKAMLRSFEAYVAAVSAGIADLTANRPTQAIDVFRKLAREYPANFEAHHYLGYALAANGRHAAAVPEYELALRLNADYAIAEFDLAKALAATGRHREAAAHLEAGFKLEPRSTYGAMTAGIIAWARGDNMSARKAFERAVALSPDQPRTVANLAEACMRTADLDCASVAFTRLIALGYAPAAAHFNLGVIAERSGHTSDAIAEYRKALATDPALEQARQAIRRLGSS